MYVLNIYHFYVFKYWYTLMSNTINEWMNEYQNQHFFSTMIIIVVVVCYCWWFLKVKTYRWEKYFSLCVYVWWRQRILVGWWFFFSLTMCVYIMLCVFIHNIYTANIRRPLLWTIATMKRVVLIYCTVRFIFLFLFIVVVVVVWQKKNYFCVYFCVFIHI